MRTHLLCGFSVVILVLGCAQAPPSNDPKNAEPERSAASSSNVPVGSIDLTRIGPLAPKGRVQDREYNSLEVVDQLIGGGSESIPFLISKLEDETELERHLVDYWYRVTVGDIAQIILVDFFTDSTWQKTTIPGLGWDQMLERRNPDITGEEVLREYIKKHGRMGIKSRWEKTWQEYKDRLFWDESERCFKVRTA